MVINVISESEGKLGTAIDAQDCCLAKVASDEMQAIHSISIIKRH
jgi:hypothetical protein